MSPDGIIVVSPPIHNESKSFLELLTIFTNMVSKHGIVNCHAILQKASDGTLFAHNDLNIAADAVSMCFDMMPFDIFGNSRKYPRKYAFALFVHIANVRLGYDYKDLVVYTRRNKSGLCRSKRIIDQIMKGEIPSSVGRKMCEKIQKKVQMAHEKLDAMIPQK